MEDEKQIKIDLLESLIESMQGCHPEYHLEVVKDELESVKNDYAI